MIIPKNVRRVRLRGIALHANFTKSESTLWDEWFKKHRTGLRTNECVLFVSGSRQQLLFVLRLKDLEGMRGMARVLDTRRWRLTAGTWNPDMLQNYAHSVGLHFEGIKRFEELYAERKLKKLLQAAT